LIGLFRSSKVPVVYTDLHDRLKAIAGAEDAEKIIIAIAEVLVVFSAPSMTNLMEPSRISFQMSSSSVQRALEKLVSST